VTDGKNGDDGAEELVANALRAHAARAPVPQPAAEPEAGKPSEEPTKRIEPVPENRDRLLAPHDVDSSVEIEAELDAIRVRARRPAPEPEPRGHLPIHWILLLAVLLGLAAGAVAGLLTVL
jgi:hypothetical protein